MANVTMNMKELFRWVAVSKSNGNKYRVFETPNGLVIKDGDEFTALDKKEYTLKFRTFH